MDTYMGAIYLDGVSPTSMGYTELRYYHRWHEREVAAIKAAQG